MDRKGESEGERETERRKEEEKKRERRENSLGHDLPLVITLSPFSLS